MDRHQDADDHDDDDVDVVLDVVDCSCGREHW